MTWLVLIIAGLFETAMAIALSFSEGFTRLMPSLAMVAAGAVSFFLLSLAMRSIPVGTAYAVWTAIGASGTVVVGILFLDESANPLRIAGIVAVLSGVLMLKLAEG